MHIPSFLIIPNDFKECLPAHEVGMAIKKGILSVFENATVKVKPMADGGPGTVDTIITAIGGNKIDTIVNDPLGRKINASFGVLPDKKTAIIEMSAASGLERLAINERNPMLTSSYGTGELIKKALNIGCTKIYVGLGGSATNDAGVGMASALGIKFVDNDGNELSPGGGNLSNLAQIDFNGFDKRIHTTKIIALTDVSSLLLGSFGTSKFFAPQKGATPEMVDQLEDNLAKLANLVTLYTGINMSSIKGGGAAGGLGAGLKAFLGAEIESGFEFIASVLKLEEDLKAFDFLITAEGKLDAQTLAGKTPMGVLQLASKYNKPVIIFTGNAPDTNHFDSINNYSIFLITKRPILLENAIPFAPIWLEDAAANFSRIISMRI